MLTRLCSLAFGVLLALPTAAGNYSFLRQEGPLQRFTDADFALFEQGLANALNASADGAVSKWQNPDTGAFGSFQPLASYEAFESQCRTLRMFSSAGEREGEAVFDFCRQPDGDWKVAPRRVTP